MEVQRILPNDCHLSTKENLNLIDILYQQDLDLGVNKEIFDPAFREKLEQERQLEYVKQQEWQKAQLLAKEKEEQKKREENDRWLKQHFRRDGETGEWVQLWTETNQNKSNPQSFITEDSNRNDEYMSLRAALDFLGNLGRDQENKPICDLPDDSVLEMQTQQFETMLQQEQPFITPQDNFDENWNGLVDYLNMTANSNDTANVLQLSNNMCGSTRLDLGLGQNAGLQADCLIQNSKLPSSTMNINTVFNTMTSVEKPNPSGLVQSTNMNYVTEFDLNEFNNFSDVITPENTSVDDIDLTDVGKLLQNIQYANDEIELDKTLIEHMDAIKKNEYDMSISTSSAGSTSPLSTFGETCSGLERAAGSCSSNYGDLNESFSKVSHHSESSNDSGFVYQNGFSSPSSSSSSFSSYVGSPASSHSGITSSASNNDTENYPNGICDMIFHHKIHNHPYNPASGQVPRETKKNALKEPSRKGPQSRDQRRAEELKIPYTLEEIVDSSVEKLNEMLTTQTLSEAQLSLIRDIRRRGKNKVAAQNCRKRKVGVIFTLADEMTELQKLRDRLVAERAAMDRERRVMREKFGYLYTHIFQSLRDENGEPYDPNIYSLQQSIDGSVFVVPRNIPLSNKNGSISSSPSSSSDSAGSKMHKSF